MTAAVLICGATLTSGCGSSTHHDDDTAPSIATLRQRAVDSIAATGLGRAAAVQVAEGRADILAAQRAHDPAQQHRAVDQAAVALAAGFQSGARHILGGPVVRTFRIVFNGVPAPDRRRAGRVVTDWAARMLSADRLDAGSYSTIRHGLSPTTR